MNQEVQNFQNYGWKSWNNVEYLNQLIHNVKHPLKSERVVRASSFNSYAHTEDKKIVMIGTHNVVAISVKGRVIVVHKNKIGELPKALARFEAQKQTRQLIKLYIAQKQIQKQSKYNHFIYQIVSSMPDINRHTSCISSARTARLITYILHINASSAQASPHAAYKLFMNASS